MAVGLNAKMPVASPEAVSGIGGDKGGEGEGFAQMLTGIVSGPVVATASVPGDKIAEGGNVAQMLDIAAATPAAAVAAPTMTAPAQAVAAAAPQTVVVSQGIEDMLPDRTPSVPANPELPRCIVELGDLASKLLHLERALGLPGKDTQDPKVSDDADGDSETDTQDAPSGDQAVASALAAALAGTKQAPVPANGGAPVAKADPAPSAPTGKIQAGPEEKAAKVAIQPGLAKVPAQPETAIAVASKDAPAVKAEDLLKSLEPVKPFALPQQLHSLVKAGFAHAVGKDSSADAAQSALAALNRSSDRAADAPFAVPAPAMSPMFVASVQALVQPQLAADALAATDIPAAANAAAPDTAQLGIDRQLDIARDNQWLDRLAQDISRSAGQEGTLKFKLNPETLGTLHVEIAQSHAGTSVRLTTDTEAARNIIADAQPRLVAEARAQGVRIAEAHVGMNSNGQHADQRRQDDARQEAFVRTARPAEIEGEQTQQSSSAAAERFA